MKYDAHLSNLLNNDIYVMNNGAIYLQFRGNQFNIGTTKNTIAELRSKVETYV